MRNKEILEAHHRLAELEPVWEMFIAKHNDKEEAREQEQRLKEAVAAQPSERRNRRLEDTSDQSDPRLLTSDPPSGAAADTTHLATPRGADNVPSSAPIPGSASTFEMFSTASTSLESGRAPSPSSATVNSDAARAPEFNRGSSDRQVKDAHQEGTGSSSSGTLLRREELIPDSMRKIILASLEMKTLKAFRKIFTHHTNADTKISDLVSYISVNLNTQVRAQICSVVDPKTDTNQFTAAQVGNWQDMDVLMLLDVLIEHNAATLVGGNSLMAALENIELNSSSRGTTSL